MSYQRHRPKRSERTGASGRAESVRHPVVGTRPVEQAEVAAAIEPVLGEFSLVLEGITCTGPEQNRTVEVIIDYAQDSTEQLSLDALAEISEAFSAALDAADTDDEFFPYQLQVSSPGATRELTARRHWVRARNRLLAVTGTNGTEYLARLDEVGEEGPVLSFKKQTKKGQRESYRDATTVAWEEIARARVEIDFNSTVNSVE